MGESELKTFKQFLREEDAKASTTTTAQGGKPQLSFEIPPGYPGSYQEGPPAPRPSKPNFMPLPAPRGPRFYPEKYETLEDYIREFDDWFLEQGERGVFEGWTEEEIYEWYKEKRKKIEERWKRFPHGRQVDLFPPEHTYT